MEGSSLNRKRKTPAELAAEAEAEDQDEFTSEFRFGFIGEKEQIIIDNSFTILCYYIRLLFISVIFLIFKTEFESSLFLTDVISDAGILPLFGT
ncbi:hypothetical protein TNIN_148511 [Trichonephila inaurata madagascariensis]|uniref:Uncharacterized protein n=1 Tax=Trichonephila inaurata madagascariensis TaxID=2747483 RepID=A0A8X6Y8B9_9ARAC|nr:hypothetical protein TNIN_148511 [Trichonephila inaurata madagascariensis]